jgi:hypothetical protein
MPGLRWLLVFLFWAALDLSGPLLPVPIEAFEGSEEATPRPRDREVPPRSELAGGHGVRDDAARLSRLVALTSPRRELEASAPRKLPSSDPGPDPASDDH